MEVRENIEILYLDGDPQKWVGGGKKARKQIELEKKSQNGGGRRNASNAGGVFMIGARPCTDGLAARKIERGDQRFIKTRG